METIVTERTPPAGEAEVIHARMKGKVNWGKCTNIVVTLCPSVRERVNDFLKGHPEWNAEVEVASRPPQINLRFWVKPQAGSNRKTTGARRVSVCDSQSNRDSNGRRLSRKFRLC